MSPKKTTNYIVTKSNDYVVRNGASDPTIPFTSQTLTDIQRSHTDNLWPLSGYTNSIYCHTVRELPSYVEFELHRTLLLRQLTLVGV
jgi:hypothetical protein